MDRLYIYRRLDRSLGYNATAASPTNHKMDIEMQNVDVRESVFNQLQLTEETVENEDILRSSKDRQYSIRSLTIMATRLLESKTLMSFSDSQAKLKWFLIVAGNYWPKGGQFILTKIHFVVTRLAILACAAFLAYFFSFYAEVAYSYDALSYLWVILALYGMLFLGTLSVLPAQYVNQLRLWQPAEVEDFMVAEESVRVSVTYGAVSMACVFVAIILQCLQDDFINPTYLMACIASMYVVLSLMFNMLFLMLDLKVALLLLDQLHLLADRKMLTIDKLNMVRTEIKRRVNASKLACDFIIIPSLASIVGIVVSILLINQVVQYSNHIDDFNNDFDYEELYTALTEQYAGLAIMQLKELFFVALAFSYVAKVNARADELTDKLSEGFWGQYDDSTESSAELVQKGQLLPDLHRMSMYMSSLSKPIGFTLIFYRVSWKSVIVSGVSFAVTVVVSIIKSAVGGE